MKGTTMRLACPHCGAQYEVPDDAIPPEGRDVQCSACGHTWFEAGAGDEAAWAEPDWPPSDAPVVEGDPEEEDDLAEVLAQPPEIVDEREPEPEPEPEPLAEPDLMPEPEPEPAALSEPDPEPYPEPLAEAAAPPHDPAPVSSVSAAVAEILRAEAAHEASIRAAATVARAAAPPPGVVPAPPAPNVAPAIAQDIDQARAEEARRRMARLREEAEAEAPPRAAPTRRGRLPDIEEINSSLSDSPPPEVLEIEPQGPGFRLGFGSVLVVAGLLALLYALGPRIERAAPALKPVIDPYVALIDDARLWLDRTIRDFVAPENS